MKQSVESKVLAKLEQDDGLTYDKAYRLLGDLYFSTNLETRHRVADEILLALIDDEDVREAFALLEKWYA